MAKAKVVEVDETYIGGKEKNKHANKRKHLGRAPSASCRSSPWSSATARPQLSRCERHGQDLRPILEKHASMKSTMMTDESALYPSIGSDFARHGTVNHGAGEYVKTGTDDHTNSVESHFALFKRGVCGTFHSLSEAHLHCYLAEFDLRANHRDINDAERAEALLTAAKGKRLMYRQPD